MRKLLGVTLGIMTALGGFVDFGQIVFTLQAGASFRYALLWQVVLGTVAIIVYMEMCGRIAVVAREPVFAIVRDKLGKALGFAVLVASNLLNLITFAAELGGIAIVLHLLTGLPEKLLLVAAAVALGLIIALLQFQWIERIFGLAGVTMVVTVVSACLLGPNWKALAHGVTPNCRWVTLIKHFGTGISPSASSAPCLWNMKSISILRERLRRIGAQRTCPRTLWSQALALFLAHC